MTEKISRNRSPLLRLLRAILGNGAKKPKSGNPDMVSFRLDTESGKNGTNSDSKFATHQTAWNDADDDTKAAESPAEPFTDAEYAPDFEEPTVDVEPPQYHARQETTRHYSAPGWIGLFTVSKEEFRWLFKSPSLKGSKNKWRLFFVGVFLTPITLTGALLGWIRGYKRFDGLRGLPPQMERFTPVMRIATFLGAVLIWVVLIGSFFIYAPFTNTAKGLGYPTLIYLGINFICSIFVFAVFQFWWYRARKAVAELRKFGTARLAVENELADYRGKPGLYIGGGLTFSDMGHLTTVAGTRGGKGVNLIIPNLLGAGGYQGSWVVIDPKGENFAITARFQRESGKRVIALNPWHLFAEKSDSFNPLDILSDKTSLHLSDDADMIAAMLVPIGKDEKDPFFPEAARTILSGIIVFIAVTRPKEEHTLETLWAYVRRAGDDWQGLIAEMRLSDDEQYGETIRNAGNELVKHSESSETLGSIMSHVLLSTDFIKSPALRKTLRSGFDPDTLADGNTVVYLVIPADKIVSHSRWLRLVVTSLMRAIIRKPDKRVTFLLDEFAALGHLPEIKTAISMYAGFNITLWLILQSLVQLKELYGNGWERFIGDTAVRHFFNINDNFSAKYVSQALGQSSNMIYDYDEYGKANSRPLLTQDEVRRVSGTEIFAFIGSLPAVVLPKQPYYTMDELEGRADDNPYYKP